MMYSQFGESDRWKQPQYNQFPNLSTFTNDRSDGCSQDLNEVNNSDRDNISSSSGIPSLLRRNHPSQNFSISDSDSHVPGMRDPYPRTVFREGEPAIRNANQVKRLVMPRGQNGSRLNDWSDTASDENNVNDRDFVPASFGNSYPMHGTVTENGSYSGVGSIISGANRDVSASPNTLFAASHRMNSNALRDLDASSNFDTIKPKAVEKMKSANTFSKFFSSLRRSKSQVPKPSADHDPEIPVTTKRRASIREIYGSNSGSGLPVTAKVLLLDGEEVSVNLERQSLGQELMLRVCDGQDILEPDYFGLTYTDAKCGTWFWLDPNKKILKQVPDIQNWQFFFQVKFYPPEPSMLQDETTRYQLALQVRQDVFTGKLPCSWVTQALLGSFMVQSEIGDFDPNQHVDTSYLKRFEFVRTPSEQLLQKISELHATHKGMKPAQADIKYLETAKRLELYGLDLHPAHDMESVEIYIGVGVSGVVIYRDRIRIGRFAWPKVLRISYKKNNFYLKIRPDYTEPVETMVGFHLLNPLLAKRLWKAAVEHHAFFRLKEPRPQKRTGSVGSHHQYTGRTFFQYRTLNIVRPLNESKRPTHHERTASVPSSLQRAGLQYNSIHSLNRTHPRDMTLGKAQSSDYLGPKRNAAVVNLPRKDKFPAVDPHSAHDQIRHPPQSQIQPVDPDVSLFENSSRNDGSFLGQRSDDYEEPLLVYGRGENSTVDRRRVEPLNQYLNSGYSVRLSDSPISGEIIDNPYMDSGSQQIQSAYYAHSNGSLLSDADTLSYADSNRQLQNSRTVDSTIHDSRYQNYNPRNERLLPRNIENSSRPVYANLNGNRILSRPPANPAKPRHRQVKQIADDDFL